MLLFNLIRIFNSNPQLSNKNILLCQKLRRVKGISRVSPFSNVEFTKAFKSRGIKKMKK